MSCANHRIKAGKTQSECKQCVLHTRQDRRQPLDCGVLGAFLLGTALLATARLCCCASFPGVRGKSETAEHNPIFTNKAAGRGRLKPGSGWWISVFPALPKSQNGSMRQIPVPPTTPLFSHKETADKGVDVSRRGRQVNNLPHTFGNGPSLAINQREKIVSRVG